MCDQDSALFNMFHHPIHCKAAAAAVESLQSCPTLYNPRVGSPPGSPIPGILWERTLEWVAISFSNAWKWKLKMNFAQLCPTLSDSIYWSIPGSSVHGIFQARVLEWVVIAFTLQSSSHLLAIYSELGEESPWRPWRTRKSICFLSPVPPKSALCHVVLWTECVFLRFMC